MSDKSKISYYDLKLEAKKGRLPLCVGMKAEKERLTRLLLRKHQHHVIISAPSGLGKTSLIYGWAKDAGTLPALEGFHFVMFDSGSLQKIASLPAESISQLSEHFSEVENCVLAFDSFGEMIYQSPSALQAWNTIIKPLFLRDDIRVILTMQPDELKYIEEAKSHFLSHFEVIKLEPLPAEKQTEILTSYAKSLGILDAGEMISEIINLTTRFASLGALPKSAITLFDECLSAAEIIGEQKLKGPVLSPALPQALVSEKLNIPLNQLSGKEKEFLKNLYLNLSEKIAGQDESLEKITSIIQRGRLGLKNENRPLASFLLLGPSGVGKTETAKVLADLLYGGTNNFLRVDMSEFSQEHSVARLVGSPAGYIGYSEGGQLTNHFNRHPYSLLLLDEIEKAHSKTFDIFLQVLDDGRLTSGQGQTVDFTQSVIFATSNAGVDDIIEGFNNKTQISSGDFIKKNLMPKLLQNFRPEFLNRFDAILVYNPLSTEALMKIALLEIAKIEKRIQKHALKFEIDPENLIKDINRFADPRFGARPVKRFIEETCENLIAEALLSS